MKAKETEAEKLLRVKAALERTPDLTVFHMRINMGIPKRFLDKWVAEKEIVIAKPSRKHVNSMHCSLMSTLSAKK